MKRVVYIAIVCIFTMVAPAWAKNGTTVPIMLWHTVRPDFPKKNFIAVKVTEFEKQIKYLKDSGYHSISLAQYNAYLSGTGMLPSKPIVLAFDDGLRHLFDYAIPIMKRNGFRATFFIYTQFFDRPSKNFMTADDLKRVIKDGFEIGCHSYTHDYLTPRKNESPEKFRTRMHKEIVRSKEMLEKNLGQKIIAMAYPFGEYSDDAITMMKESGYTMGLTINEGVNDDSVDPFHIHRMMLITRDSLASFKLRLDYGVLPVGNPSIKDGAMLDHQPRSLSFSITDPAILAKCYKLRITLDELLLPYTMTKDGRVTATIKKDRKRGFHLLTIYGYQKGGKVWTNSTGFSVAVDSSKSQKHY